MAALREKDAENVLKASVAVAKLSRSITKHAQTPAGHPYRAPFPLANPPIYARVGFDLEGAS
jgi:hypothetical protein